MGGEGLGFGVQGQFVRIVFHFVLGVVLFVASGLSVTERCAFH